MIELTPRRNRHRRSRRPHVLGAALAALALIAAQAAAGALTLTMSANDAPSISITLNGADQTASDAFDIDVKDTRVVAAGWNVQITSTTFRSGAHALPNTAARITGATASCDGGICVAPLNTVNYPFTVPAATNAPPSVRLFNAAALTGSGDFTVRPTFQVTVPANAYAGNYSNTITITIASGP